MNKNKKLKRKYLKINKQNDIESIIEIFQRFSPKYDVYATTLDKEFHYATKNTKISQIYKSNLSKNNITPIVEKIRNKGHVTIIIIDNTGYLKDNMLEKNIRKLKNLKNVSLRFIKQKELFKTIESIIQGD